MPRTRPGTRPLLGARDSINTPSPAAFVSQSHLPSQCHQPALHTPIRGFKVLGNSSFAGFPLGQPGAWRAPRAGALGAPELISIANRPKISLDGSSCSCCPGHGPWAASSVSPSVSLSRGYLSKGCAFSRAADTDPAGIPPGAVQVPWGSAGTVSWLLEKLFSGVNHEIAVRVLLLSCFRAPTLGRAGVPAEGAEQHWHSHGALP